MRFMTRTLVLTAATLAFAGGLSQANTQTPAARHRATSLVAKGTIAGFDHTSKVLTVKTAKGQEQFTLADSVRIREASKRLTAADLDHLNGRNVTVRYTETGGQRAVQSVQVAGGGKKIAKS